VDFSVFAHPLPRLSQNADVETRVFYPVWRLQFYSRTLGADEKKPIPNTTETKQPEAERRMVTAAPVDPK